MSRTESVNTMNEPFLSFEWQVAAAYQWAHWLNDRGKPSTVPTKILESPSAVELAWSAARRRGRVAGPVLDGVASAGVQRSYFPMSKATSSLFLTFAEIDYRNLSSISDFAAKYGLLGLSTVYQSVPDPTDSAQNYYAHGETYLDWVREICLMREAVQLTQSDGAVDNSKTRAEWNSAKLDLPYGERQERCAWLLNSHLQDVQPRIVFAADMESRLSFAPTSLLSAAWLQFALSLAGDKEFRSCKFCRRLFEISTEQTGFRSHREFCTDSCKTKDYRKRRRTALRLTNEGKPLREVSEKTNTEVATIRAWLAAAKPMRNRKKGVS